MPDFSFPAWLRETHSFADSLAKGAQVGSIIANNRYRNQALAAQAIDAERNYALREKSLQIDQEQRDIMMKSKLLEMETNKQMLADQVSDKETLSQWIPEYNKLSPEERLSMPLPNVRLPATFNAINQIRDNDRMAYSQSAKGRAADALEYRIRQLPSDTQYLFDTTDDPREKLSILKAGEAEMFERDKALKAIAPTIVAEGRKDVAEINATARERLAELKTMASVEKSQGASEAEWVNRHLNTVLLQLANDNDFIDKSVELRTDAATKLLQKTYRETGLGAPAVVSPTRVRVKAPDGTIGTISTDSLDAALKQGYQRVE